MSIRFTVTVNTTQTGSSPSINQLIQEIERLKRYDGTTVHIAAGPPCISLIPQPKPLYQVVEQMLAEADAATSPHYRGSPQGLPYTLRVEAAMRAFKNASPEFRREAERRSLGVPPRNREEFFKQNPEIFEYFYGPRPQLETEFLKRLL